MEYEKNGDPITLFTKEKTLYWLTLLLYRKDNKRSEQKIKLKNVLSKNGNEIKLIETSRSTSMMNG